MERRDDIKAAIHRLLANGDAEDAPAEDWQLRAPEAYSARQVNGKIPYTDSQIVTLKAVQASLRAHRIEADLPDIVNALLEALSTRPSLCRGLVAAYLLGA